MKKKNIYFWASDFSNNTGEGKLARLFIVHLEKDENNKLHQIKIAKNSVFLNYRYVNPFIGICYCWKLFFKKERIAYINYLPLWNPLIFILLPPGTIIGPVTGGALFNKRHLLNYLLRKYLFPLLYKISEFFLSLRTESIFFSTDLLKKYLSKKTLKKSRFNFVLINLVFKKKFIKKLDFLIYYRKHKNKEKFFPYNFVTQLIKLGFKISIIGDKLNMPLVKNYGKIPNSQVLKLQSITRYTIGSGENPYSLFNVECISNNVKIIIDQKDLNIIKAYKKHFITLNFDKYTDVKTINKKFFK